MIGYLINYMLYPLVMLILGLLAVIIAKKNQLLSNRKAVTYVLLSSVVFSLFGLSGFCGMYYMPQVFLFFQFIFLLLGFVNYKLLNHFISGLKEKHIGFTLLIVGFQLILAWAIYTVLFNFTSDLQYGIWAASPLLLLLFFPMFMMAYRAYLQIPVEIYKMRVYKSDERHEPPQTFVDVESLSVYEIEVPRYVGDNNPIRIKGRALKSFIFDEWFGMVVTDWNAKKLNNQIEICNDEKPYGWIFYTEQSFLKSRKYLDPDLSFEDNKLAENEVIIAKRVVKKS